jgi:hypothetical protein
MNDPSSRPAQKRARIKITFRTKDTTHHRANISINSKRQFLGIDGKTATHTESQFPLVFSPYAPKLDSLISKTTEKLTPHACTTNLGSP